MKTPAIIPFLCRLVPACAALACLCGPAQAVVTVVGSSLAYDCFAQAKAGTDPRDGIATCDSALENQALTPHDRAGTLVNRAVMKVALQRIDDALKDYDAGIALAPDLGDAYVDRGGALIYKQRYDEAMTDINRGIALGMTYPFAGYYNRAVAEQLLGRFKEAYYDYKKTLALEPNFTRASDRLKDFTVTVVRKPAGD